MSDSATPTLPDPQTAYTHLFQNVRADVLFRKLASYGIQPTTDKEAEDLLELAGKLRLAEESQPIKQAGQSRFGEPNLALDRVLGDKGLDGPVKQAASQEQNLAVQQYACRLAEDPYIYNAVLALKQAQADALAEQLVGEELLSQ